MTLTRFSRTALLAGATLLLGQPAIAQGGAGGGGNPAWFVPSPQKAPAQARPVVRAQSPRPAVPAGAPGPDAADLVAAPPGEAPLAPVQAQLPPMPAIPDVARGSMPPAAVIGVLSIPDVLRASEAYKEADKTMAARRQKLNEDAQKEQVTLRDLGQALGNERSKLSADQIRAKERELQDRITESRRKFSERGRIIQEASQYALAQIERTLSEVVQRVSGARGMNLVLQRAEVALNQGEFDITAQVAEVLNKALPTVLIPPEGVAPGTLPAVASAAPGTTPAPAASHKPASHTAQHR
ncbi:MAG: OmpH family outer membrane protein [Acetobacteraceae bacterium]